jgi:hypothetical protein
VLQAPGGRGGQGGAITLNGQLGYFSGYSYGYFSANGGQGGQGGYSQNFDAGVGGQGGWGGSITVSTDDTSFDEGAPITLADGNDVSWDIRGGNGGAGGYRASNESYAFGGGGGNGSTLTISLNYGGWIDAGGIDGNNNGGMGGEGGGSVGGGASGSVVLRANNGDLTVSNASFVGTTLYLESTSGKVLSGGSYGPDAIADSIHVSASTGIGSTATPLWVAEQVPTTSLHFTNNTGDVFIASDYTLHVDQGYSGGNITLISTSANSESAIQLNRDNAQANVTASGSVTYVADQFGITGTGVYGNTVAGTYIALKPYSSGRNVKLSGLPQTMDADTATTLVVNNDELARFSAPKLWLQSTSGNATLGGGSINLPSGMRLEMTAYGSIQIDSGSFLSFNAVDPAYSAQYGYGAAVVLAGNGFDNQYMGDPLISQGGGHWQIWNLGATDTSAADTALTSYDYTQFGAAYDVAYGSGALGAATVYGSGNGFIYFKALDPVSINLTGASASRVYDGTTNAVVTLAANAVTGGRIGDTLDGGALTGTYDTKDVTGSPNKVVTITGGGTLTATDVNNKPVFGYTSTALPGSFYGGEITPYVVSLSGSKVYDGTATIGYGSFTLGTLVGAESLVLSGSGSLASRNVTLAPETVMLDSLTLGNGSGLSSNYTLSGGTHTASIAPLALTITAVTESRPYDGTTDAVGIPVTGTLAYGDSITGLSQRYQSKHVMGTLGSTLEVDPGYTLDDGNGGNNYILTLNTVTGTITKKVLTVSGIVANDKVYDSTTVATLGGTLAGVVYGDVVGIAATASFADKNVNVGAPKPVTVYGGVLSLTGVNAGNYALYGGGTISGLTANITPATLSFTGVTAEDKVYDGNVSATLSSGTLSGVFYGDGVSVSGGTGSFDDKNVGEGKIVTITGATLSGPDAGNYVMSASGTTKASITPATLKISAITAAATKVYDGTDKAVLYGGELTGKIDGDDVNFSGIGTFNNKNVGDSKVITLADSSLSGDDAGNYIITGVPTGTLTGSITQLESVEWIGGASGNWSVGSNWRNPTTGKTGAVPDLTNVAKVNGLSGVTVNFDVTSATFAGLSLGGLNQSGGTLTVTGGISVLGGSISQSGGALITPSLNATTVGGINLSGANQIGSFTASNSGSGNVVLKNTFSVFSGSVTNPVGSVTVDNNGATIINGVTSGATITLAAHSPLTINGTVSAGGSISLLADNGGALTQNANVTSTGGGSISVGGGTITMSPTAVTSTNGGTISLSATGNIVLGSLNAGSGAIAASSTSGGITTAPGAPKPNVIAKVLSFDTSGNNPIDIAIPAPATTKTAEADKVVNEVTKTVTSTTQTTNTDTGGNSVIQVASVTTPSSSSSAQTTGGTTGTFGDEKEKEKEKDSGAGSTSNKKEDSQESKPSQTCS